MFYSYPLSTFQEFDVSEEPSCWYWNQCNLLNFTFQKSTRFVWFLTLWWKVGITLDCFPFSISAEVLNSDLSSAPPWVLEKNSQFEGTIRYLGFLSEGLTLWSWCCSYQQNLILPGYTMHYLQQHRSKTRNLAGFPCTEMGSVIAGMQESQSRRGTARIAV